MTPKPGQNLCLVSAYLESEELICRRLERTANADTPLGREWRTIADMLAGRRELHAKACERCRGK
jgi:hypothetical protein